MEKSKILRVQGGGLCRMCRICLTKDAQLASLNSVSAQLKGPIIDSLSLCASVRVKKGDGLPLFICKECYVEMLRVNRFQTLAKTSERTLKKYLRKLSNKSISEKRCDSVAQNQSYSKKKVIDSSLVKKSNVTRKINSNNICPVSQANLGTLLLATKVSPVKSSVSSTSVVLLVTAINTTQTPLNTTAAPINASTLPINTVSPICTALTGQKTSVSSVNTPVPPIIEIDIEDKNEVIVINDDKVEISTSNIEQNTHRQMNDRHPLSSKNDTNLDLRTTTNSDDGTVSNNRSKDLQNKRTDSNIVNTQNSTMPSNINSPTDDEMVLVIDESEPEQCRSDIENIPKNKEKQTTVTIENEKEILLSKFTEPINKLRQEQIEFFEKRQLNLKYQTVSYECHICNDKFSSKKDIILHRRKHPNERSFRCDTCGCRFVKWKTLNKHKQLYEGKCKKRKSASRPKQREGKYACAFCGIDFKYHNEMKKHCIVHPTCTVCEKMFADSDSLLTHICQPQLIHECDICNKRFKKSTALNNHRSTHGIKKGEKIYLCDICRKRFDTLVNLVEHKRTHNK